MLVAVRVLHSLVRGSTGTARARPAGVVPGENIKNNGVTRPDGRHAL